MKILVSAYACEPGKGSEPGAGWAWAAAAAERHDVWVLTRANNREAIESELARRPRPTLRPVYLDLPPALRAWKRRQRGVRTYYLLWQVLAARVARRLHREHGFNVVHHVTFANMWLPAPTRLRGVPFVLGPVGGGVHVPVRLYPSLGARGAGNELRLRALRAAARVSPLVRLTWRRAAVIVAQNEETRSAFTRGLRPRVVVRPNACTAESPPERHPLPAGPPVAVYAGRLTPWKGVALAVRALSRLPEWELLVLGSGPEEKRLRRLARRLGVEDRLRLVPWVPREEVLEILARSTALVLPSLRDDASLISPEAQAVGTPVVAFGRGGPAALARFPGAQFELVPLRGGPDACAAALADGLRRAAAGPRPGSYPFGLDGVARDVDGIYRRACAAGAAPVAEGAR